MNQQSAARLRARTEIGDGIDLALRHHQQMELRLGELVVDADER
jgi:hypothetical protein